MNRGGADAGPIGIFGGTFDPVHRGHIQAALEVADALDITDLRMLPAGDPPHRSGTHADAVHRVAMLELAVRGHADLNVDTREVDRPGPSYMVDTLEALREDHPSHPLLLIMGQDAANGLNRWHRWERLPTLAHLVIMTRPGERPVYSGPLGTALGHRQISDSKRLLQTPSGLLIHVDVSPMDLSSTEVRRRITDGESVAAMLPPGVAEYIERHGLYREPSRPVNEMTSGLE